MSAALILLLADEPMHGYQLIHAVAERTQGVWNPSPGAVYPKLAQLETEGLVSMTSEGGRKRATLTESGVARAEELRSAGTDPFLDFTARNTGPDLRGMLKELHVAARQVGVAGTTDQVAAAAHILGQAKRSLYLILAAEPELSGSDPTKQDDISEH